MRETIYYSFSDSLTKVLQSLSVIDKSIIPEGITWQNYRLGLYWCYLLGIQKDSKISVISENPNVKSGDVYAYEMGFNFIRFTKDPLIRFDWNNDTPLNYHLIEYLERYETLGYIIWNFHSPVAQLKIPQYEFVREGILNIFYRLTQYSDGSIVPLIDLLDNHTANVVVQFGHNPDKTNHVLNLVTWQYLVESILLILKTLGVEFPAEYLEYLNAFEASTKLKTNLKESSSYPTLKNALLQSCDKCHSEQSVLIRDCQNCGNSLKYCNICKRGFGSEEVKSLCSHCNLIFHRIHLYAYVQSKGQCPVCKENLTLSLLDV